MHSHLYLKKRKRRVVLTTGDTVFMVEYVCVCGDWWKRQIKLEKDIPSVWNWEIFSDEPIKMQNIPLN